MPPAILVTAPAKAKTSIILCHLSLQKVGTDTHMAPL
jgi:hypothetical protein